MNGDVLLAFNAVLFLTRLRPGDAYVESWKPATTEQGGKS